MGRKSPDINFCHPQKLWVCYILNNNLEQQAQAIFDNMFPNTSSGDKFIGDFITPKRGKNLLSKNAILGDVPVVAGGLEPSTYHNVSSSCSRNFCIGSKCWIC